MAKGIEINGKKLARLIDENGYSSTELSVKLGYNGGYINDAIKRNCISRPGAYAIAQILNTTVGEMQKANEESQIELHTIDSMVLYDLEKISSQLDRLIELWEDKK